LFFSGYKVSHPSKQGVDFSIFILFNNDLSYFSQGTNFSEIESYLKELAFKMFGSRDCAMEGSVHL
jgi:hypothetical protein